MDWAWMCHIDGRQSHPRAEHLKFLFLNDKRLWRALGRGPAVRKMVSWTKPMTRLTHPTHSQLGWRQWQQVSWCMVWSLLLRQGFSLVPSRVARDDPCVRLPEEGNIKHSTSLLWPSAILGYMWLEKRCYSAPSSGMNNRTVSSGNIVQGHFPLLESCLLLPQLLPWACPFGVMFIVQSVLLFLLCFICFILVFLLLVFFCFNVWSSFYFVLK